MRWLLMVLILTLVLAEPIRTLKRRRKGQKDDNEVIVNVSKCRCWVPARSDSRLGSSGFS